MRSSDRRPLWCDACHQRVGGKANPEFKSYFKGGQKQGKTPVITGCLSFYESAKQNLNNKQHKNPNATSANDLRCTYASLLHHGDGSPTIVDDDDAAAVGRRSGGVVPIEQHVVVII